MTAHNSDHPRIRGEHRPRGFRSAPGPGSSPHTRGAPRRRLRNRRHPGIIPAYAGSTMSSLPRTSRDTDHPRIRGEHYSLPRPSYTVKGSSPHTRGAPLFFHGVDPGLGIIPAYAGSTHPSRALRSFSRDHPRIRGEHAVDVGPDRRRRGSSPHTRGARLKFGDDHLVDGIIPAYAGSTRAETEGGTRMSDHPRIRGEHRPVQSRPRGQAGSSPHTRGALHADGVDVHPVRIIPAYAGSTGRFLSRPALP